jgi:hypothetical protein
MQIGLAPLMVALAAPWSEEKSHGTDDATVRVSPSRVGRRWLATSNSRQSIHVLDACGSATGHATPMVTRELTERGGHGHVSFRATWVEPAVANDITTKNASAVERARACRPDQERDKLSGTQGSMNDAGLAACPSSATSPSCRNGTR